MLFTPMSSNKIPTSKCLPSSSLRHIYDFLSPIATPHNTRPDCIESAPISLLSSNRNVVSFSVFRSHLSFVVLCLWRGDALSRTRERKLTRRRDSDPTITERSECLVCISVCQWMMSDNHFLESSQSAAGWFRHRIEPTLARLEPPLPTALTGRRRSVVIRFVSRSRRASAFA